MEYACFQEFSSILPIHIFDLLEENVDDRTSEIIIDVGRPLLIRYNTGLNLETPITVFQSEINEIKSRVDTISRFNKNNRAGLKNSLHRISQIVNSNFETIGFTIRLGREIKKLDGRFTDLLNKDQNILIIGVPGSGKSSLLRSIIKEMSEFRNVVVVDKSNEIAGDNDIPHQCIGKARRLQIPYGGEQFRVMIEAVENHAPDVIAVDEISDRQESFAARSIAERGVRLIATAHGKTINSVLKNPILMPLIGDIKSVTLGDEETKRRELENKTTLERVSEPTFDLLVELIDKNSYAIYYSIIDCVDAILTGKTVNPEIRRFEEGKNSYIVTQVYSIEDAKNTVLMEPEITIEERVKSKTSRHRK